MSTPLRGENGIVYIYDPATEEYKPVACLTSNSLSTTVEVIERQTKCAPGVVEKSAGSFNYSLSLEGEYIDTTTVGGDSTKDSHDALLILQQERELIDWFLDTNVTDNDSVKYYGKALITDLSLDQGTNENSTFSATFDGSGAILYEAPVIPSV
jgi:predicted secreted protein